MKIPYLVLASCIPTLLQAQQIDMQHLDLSKKAAIKNTSKSVAYNFDVTNPLFPNVKKKFAIPNNDLVPATTLCSPQNDTTVKYNRPTAMTNFPMYMLNIGVFFSPSTTDMYFNPALDAELGFWKTNKKNFLSWGASAEVWYFTSVQYDQNMPVIMNNTDGFINLNAMFFYDNKIIAPYIAPTFSFASDFKNAGFAGGIALGLNHKTAKRLQTFVQAKSIKFSNKLIYLNMHFYMVGLSLNLSD